jgi:prevent-host-death family protein
VTIVGVLEARNDLSALIKRARGGEEIVIASRDVPQVRLVPVSPPPEHGIGAALI